MPKIPDEEVERIAIVLYHADATFYGDDPKKHSFAHESEQTKLCYRAMARAAIKAITSGDKRRTRGG